MSIILITKKLREQLKRKERAINRELKKYGFSIADLLPSDSSAKMRINYTFTILPPNGVRRLTTEQEAQLRDVLRKHVGKKDGAAR